MEHYVQLQQHVPYHRIDGKAPVQVLGAVVPDYVPGERDVCLAQVVDYEFINCLGTFVEPAPVKRFCDFRNKRLQLG